MTLYRRATPQAGEPDASTPSPWVEGDASEFGVVKVFSKPAPDAEDRLRRLFTIPLKLPDSDGQTGDRHRDNHLEAEA